ncbi:MAG: response regulator transcription factor [Bacilli bacterium]
MKNILVVDDDADLRHLVRVHAEKQQFHVVEAKDGNEALQIVREGAIDLVILDVMMPEFDGYEVCEAIRAFARVPILFLTARDSVADRVYGLNLGADDYIVKPFSGHELMARVFAVLRRFPAHEQSQSTDTIEIGRIRVHERAHRVYIDDVRVNLTLKEHELLLFLVKHHSQVFSREQLLDRVWGQFYVGTERTVDTHVKTLRMKLGDVSHYVATVWGVGYKFDVDA